MIIYLCCLYVNTVEINNSINSNIAFAWAHFANGTHRTLVSLHKAQQSSHGDIVHIISQNGLRCSCHMQGTHIS